MVTLKVAELLSPISLASASLYLINGEFRTPAGDAAKTRAPVFKLKGFTVAMSGVVKSEFVVVRLKT